MWLPVLPWPLTGLLAGPWLLVAWVALARLRQLPALPAPDDGPALPPVTLCIPARDEARDLGRALDSWLAVEHPRLRIVVVDDGSTDATPALLAQRLAAHPGRLRVLRNDILPTGWLGKNHALDLACRQPEALAASWLLLADADVQASPELLRQAFAFLARWPADLLTLLPAIDTVGFVERVFLPWATLGFLWAVPFRQVPQPGRAAHCGVGAFILVRRAAYDAVRGHAGAPMAAIDDMGLAGRIKAAGFCNRVALGGPGLHLRMYHGPGELLRGMRKNALPSARLGALAPLAAVVLLGASLGPAALALAGHPWLGSGLWALVPAVMGLVQRRFTRRPPDWAWAFWPGNGLFLICGLVWAGCDRLRGINHWRGREVRLRP